MSSLSPQYLDLAEWRRTIAQLYAEVRRIAATDPAAAHAHWRAVREALYREHPQSPLPIADRAAFRARHYPYDLALRFELPLDPQGGEEDRHVEGATPHSAVAIPTSASGAMSFRRVGSVAVPFPGGTRRLAVFWMEEYAGGLFLSFRDGTNGTATYGGGRYLLDGAKSADLGGDAAQGTVILDFNFAYQPSCAFDPRWTCPLTPPENRLDLAVEAGERLA